MKETWFQTTKQLYPWFNETVNLPKLKWNKNSCCCQRQSDGMKTELERNSWCYVSSSLVYDCDTAVWTEISLNRAANCPLYINHFVCKRVLKAFPCLLNVLNRTFQSNYCISQKCEYILWTFHSEGEKQNWVLFLSRQLFYLTSPAN